jgi:hypothetical protein
VGKKVLWNFIRFRKRDISSSSLTSFGSLSTPDSLRSLSFRSRSQIEILPKKEIPIEQKQKKEQSRKKKVPVQQTLVVVCYCAFLTLYKNSPFFVFCGVRSFFLENTSVCFFWILEKHGIFVLLTSCIFSRGIH